MNIHDELEGQLRQAANAVPLPDVSPEALARAGAREKARRRRLTVAAITLGVAFVLALGSLPALLSHTDTVQPVHPSKHHPRSSTQLGHGAASSLPWWSDGELHVGTRTISTTHREVRYAGGTTVVGDEHRRGNTWHSAWWWVNGRKLVPLLDSARGVVEPVISADGSWIAWSEPLGPTLRRLVLWSVPAERVVGTLRVPVHVTCCDQSGELFVAGIDRGSRVVYSRLGGALELWKPGRRPIKVRGVDPAFIGPQQWPRGVQWQVRGQAFGDLDVAFATVDSAGHVHRAGTVPADQRGLWSPDGSMWAYPGLADGSAPAKTPPDRIWVTDVETHQRRELRLRDVADYRLVAWDSPSSVILAATEQPSPSDGRLRLVRCDAGTGRCEGAGFAGKQILSLAP